MSPLRSFSSNQTLSLQQNTFLPDHIYLTFIVFLMEEFLKKKHIFFTQNCVFVPGFGEYDSSIQARNNVLKSEQFFIWMYNNAQLLRTLTLLILEIYNSYTFMCIYCLLQNLTYFISETIKILKFVVFIVRKHFWNYSRCSFSMMVKWANDGILQVNDGEMLVNDGERSVWSYTHFTIIKSISPSLTWSIPSFAHFTIIEKLHRLICQLSKSLPPALHLNPLFWSYFHPFCSIAVLVLT